jgi:predicted ribosome quality control (RQC) complex YloA/Tae2 family protein
MKSLTALDIKIVVEELQFLEGSRVDKISHSGSELLIKLYTKKIGSNLLRIKIGEYLTLTQYKEKYDKATPFAMTLRKYLMGYTLQSIKQLNNERIVDLVFQKDDKKYVLICEFFSKGNIVLCKPSFQIIYALKRQKWSARDVKKGKKYVLPPPPPDPFKFKSNAFRKTLLNSKVDLVRTLAIDMGLGGIYAEELCKRTKIDKNDAANELDTKKIAELFKKFTQLLKQIKRMALKPQVVFNDQMTPTPFPLEIFRDQDKKTFPTFAQAIDFATIEGKKKTKIKEKTQDLSKRVEKLDVMLKKQKETLQKSKRKEKELREEAEFIYTHHNVLEQTLIGLKKIREKFSWDEIKKKVEKPIKEIDEKKGKITFELSGRQAILNINQKAMTQANELFERAKKLKSKIKGAKQAIIKSKEQLEKAKKTKKIKVKQIASQEKKKAVPKKWFEKFHWFKSSEGFLVVAGKDAVSNEVLIKKHAESNDLVLHTDIAGSPFAVIKNGKKATKKTIEEAAIFTASFSRAWKMGYHTMNVFYVEPEQVSKKAPSGEYVAKGAFMVHGKKNYVKNAKLRLAVSFTDKPIVAPESAIEDKKVVIVPGDMKKKETAQIIIKRLKLSINVDDVMRILPSGGIKVEN